MIQLNNFIHADRAFLKSLNVYVIKDANGNDIIYIPTKAYFSINDVQVKDEYAYRLSLKYHKYYQACTVNEYTKHIVLPIPVLDKTLAFTANQILMIWYSRANVVISKHTFE